MQRRGSSGQPVKGQSANRPKARNAPTAQVSTADLQEQLDQPHARAGRGAGAAGGDARRCSSSHSPARLADAGAGISTRSSESADAACARRIFSCCLSAGWRESPCCSCTKLRPRGDELTRGGCRLVKWFLWIALQSWGVQFVTEKPVHVADLQNAGDEFASGREFAKGSGTAPSSACR